MLIFRKIVFRCNRCDASGGMLELYRRLHGVSSAEANRQIREALGKGEYRTDYQVVHKEEPVEIFNAELADADVIDRTYQEMLSLLTLNDKHQEDLKKRGLTKEQIEIQRYRSVPLFGIKNMVQKLLEIRTDGKKVCRDFMKIKMGNGQLILLLKILGF